MSKEVKIILIVSLLMFILQGRVSAFTKDNKKVIVDDNGKIFTIETKVDTLGEFLYMEGIFLNIHDIINKNENDLLSNDEENEIIIKRAFKIKVVRGGEEEDLWIFNDYTPEDVVKKFFEETGLRYIYDKEYIHTNLKEGDVLKLYKLETKEVSETEKLSFETKIIYNNNLLKGTENIVTEGKDGEKVTIFKVEFLDGEEIDREILSEKIICIPENKIIEIGTKEKVLELDKKKFCYSDYIIMNATAYSAEQPELSNRTAIGRRAVKGIVAVDPKIIPLGTNLYIEGYGNAVAADTGGAIKGNKIDLCYNTISEALSFGRRTVKVYILD